MSSSASHLSFSSPVENLTAGFLSDLWELRDRRVDGMVRSTPIPKKKHMWGRSNKSVARVL